MLNSIYVNLLLATGIINRYKFFLWGTYFIALIQSCCSVAYIIFQYFIYTFIHLYCARPVYIQFFSFTSYDKKKIAFLFCIRRDGSRSYYVTLSISILKLSSCVIELVYRHKRRLLINDLIFN